MLGVSTDTLPKSKIFSAFTNVWVSGNGGSVTNARVSMIADDTSLALQSENISQLTEALNDDLENLHL